jgi:N-acetyltransferase
MPVFDLQPNLANDLVELRPLQASDFDALFAVASDPLIWALHPVKNRSERSGFEVFFQEALTSKGAFVIKDRIEDCIIGSTRFQSIEGFDHAIEIGWSFLARSYWGGLYNAATKALLLEYAFQYVDDVIFYVNASNYRSQAAVEKIGGQRVTHLHDKALPVKPLSTVMYRIHRSSDRSKI